MRYRLATWSKLIGKKYSLSVLYSGLLFRFAAFKLIQDNPVNRITYLRKIFAKINYNKIKNMTGYGKPSPLDIIISKANKK